MQRNRRSSFNLTARNTNRQLKNLERRSWSDAHERRNIESKFNNILLDRQINRNIAQAAISNPGFNLLAPDTNQQLRRLQHRSSIPTNPAHSRLPNLRGSTYDTIQLNYGLAQARDAQWMAKSQMVPRVTNAMLREKAEIDRDLKNAAMRMLQFLMKFPHIPYSEDQLKMLAVDLGLGNRDLQDIGLVARLPSRTSSGRSFRSAPSQSASRTSSGRTLRTALSSSSSSGRSSRNNLNLTQW